MERFVINADLAEVSQKCVLLSGTYSYWNRIPALSRQEPFQYLNILDSKYESTEKPIYKLLKEKYYTEVTSLSNFVPKKAVDSYGDFRYERLYNDCIIQDKFNTIEMLCGMTYSKGLAVFYSLYDKLDFILSYLYDEPIELVREQLISNCDRYGLDYLTLSYAFCTGDPRALAGLDLGCLVGISSKLDFKLLEILESRINKIKLGDTVLDLDNEIYSSEEKITLYLCSKIGYFEHLIINLILEQYQKGKYPFISSADSIPVSIGRSNIIIAANSLSLPIIDMHFDSSILTLIPQTVLNIGEPNEDCWYNSK